MAYWGHLAVPVRNTGSAMNPHREKEEPRIDLINAPFDPRMGSIFKILRNGDSGVLGLVKEAGQLGQLSL